MLGRPLRHLDGEAGRRHALDRLLSLFVHLALLAALVPLVSVLSYTVYKGLKMTETRPGQWVTISGIGGQGHIAVQYAVAMQDSRVDALIPIITWNDLSYSLAPNNTDLAHGVTYRTPGVAKRQWVDLFFSVGITDGAQGASADPGRLGPPCPIARVVSDSSRSEQCPS